jgi:hypothetical protein
LLPVDHFRDIWNRCDELAALHLYLQRNLTAALQPDEILRAEWVMRISALDLYIHELVAQRMLAIFEGRLIAPVAFSKFDVPTEVLMRIKGATSPVESSAAFDLHVRTQLSRITYQFPEDIADGVRLCSCVELWNEIADHQGATPQQKTDHAKSLKRQLSLLSGEGMPSHMRVTSSKDPYEPRIRSLQMISKS